MYLFNTGNLCATRTDITGQSPIVFGVLQDLEVDFTRTIKELVGQYQVPVALGAGQLKISCKAKAARINAAMLNNLFFGQTQTTGMLELAAAESHSVPASTPYTVSVTNSATFAADQGVFYSATGTQMTLVASGPAQGQYSVSAGVYTFNSADASAGVNIYYTYAVSGSGQQITFANQLSGLGAPVFSVVAKTSFNQSGTVKDLVLKLNACMASKLSFPFKNQDFMIPDFEFSVMQDQTGNWGSLSLSE